MANLNLFEISAALLVLSAAFGWINTRLVRLPHTIALLVMALVASFCLIGFDHLVPASNMRETIASALGQVHLFEALMEGFLAFLLFAGALHVDFSLLRQEKWAVGLMATAGVLISTAVIGTAFWAAAQAVGAELPLIWALVFGALISPTDPVAVLAMLKSARIPERLEVRIAGESLFNDGVGIVVFIILLEIATGAPSGPAHIAELFLQEAVGGAALGLAAGWLTVRAMGAIDEYPVEILISLAMVTAVYAVALRLHLSGPIAVVVAGLLVGNRGVAHAMSEQTRRYLFNFWEVIDELLNSVLFLFIGLEVLVVAIDWSLAGLAMAAIPLVLFGRLVAVSAPILLLRFLRSTFTPGAIPVLTWGGVKGGISVALALSLPNEPVKDTILLATYFVVVFSVIVQGLTISPLARRVVIP
jgi:CPA1 family monovalent cation:H+ antiporter